MTPFLGLPGRPNRGIPWREAKERTAQNPRPSAFAIVRAGSPRDAISRRVRWSMTDQGRYLARDELRMTVIEMG